MVCGYLNWRGKNHNSWNVSLWFTIVKVHISVIAFRVRRYSEINRDGKYNYSCVLIMCDVWLVVTNYLFIIWFKVKYVSLLTMIWVYYWLIYTKILIDICNKREATILTIVWHIISHSKYWIRKAFNVIKICIKFSRW